MSFSYWNHGFAAAVKLLGKIGFLCVSAYELLKEGGFQ